jgi:hypothetical protein
MVRQRRGKKVWKGNVGVDRICLAFLFDFVSNIETFTLSHGNISTHLQPGIAAV